jgi:hypothetical protein
MFLRETSGIAYIGNIEILGLGLTHHTHHTHAHTVKEYVGFHTPHTHAHTTHSKRVRRLFTAPKPRPALAPLVYYSYQAINTVVGTKRPARRSRSRHHTPHTTPRVEKRNSTQHTTPPTQRQSSNKFLNNLKLLKCYN